MSFPTVAGRSVEGTPYREAQMCLGPRWASSYYLFFLSGTSTPANVYTNGTLTTAFPSGNRVNADAYGRFAAIYLDPSVIYRVQFFNSSGVQQWQVDPYTSQLSTVGTSSLSAYGFQIATTGEFTLDAPNTGGTGITLTLTSGSLGTAALQVTGTLAGNSAIIVNSSATTGAHTATFTATNKPGTATSSPAGWLPITCDGVQYYTPIWHGNNFTPYAANPTAVGEIIVASSVTFAGNGDTSATNGTATPSNWFSPATIGIGAGYYINITKTGGLSGLAFSAAQGAWTNITSGGLTISSNAQAAITGTYQLSTSVSGSPIVAAGTITLSGNNGVQSPTYNGASPINLAGNGTATLNGSGSLSWYAPTTASIGSGYYILITQTGGSAGTSFNTATGTPANITAGGLTISVTGGSGTTFATGTYIISSDSGGTNVLGSGTITLNGSSVQSPNWSGTYPLALAGNGSATLNGVSTSSWYSPNTSNVGSGYYINITRTSGTAGVNFSAAQGAWTNITNSGLSVGLSGTSGYVGSVSASGTYQISSSPSGSPVLGSGTISLTATGLTVVHQYSTHGAGTDTAPTGTANVDIYVSGAGGSGGSNATNPSAGGGSGGDCWSTYAMTAGKTINYSLGAGGAGVTNTAGNTGGTTTCTSGTLTITTMTANAGHGGASGVTSNTAGGAVSTGGNGQNRAGVASSGQAAGVLSGITSTYPDSFASGSIGSNGANVGFGSSAGQDGTITITYR